MSSTFLTFIPAEPKRKKPEKASDIPSIADTILKLEHSRRNEKIRFDRCIKAAEKLYRQIFNFMIRFKKYLKTNPGHEQALQRIKIQAKEHFDVLSERLHELEDLTWREQTRGPTSSKSWSVSKPDDPAHHPALWVLWTKPLETKVRDDGDAPSLNFVQGSFLTWGLPRSKEGTITLDTDVYAKGKPVFVIEKYKETDSEGKPRVQHRIKGLYFILKNIKPKSTKMVMVAWEDIINGWITGHKIEKEVPQWVRE